MIQSIYICYFSKNPKKNRIIYQMSSWKFMKFIKIVFNVIQLTIIKRPIGLCPCLLRSWFKTAFFNSKQIFGSQAPKISVILMLEFRKHRKTVWNPMNQSRVKISRWIIFISKLPPKRPSRTYLMPVTQFDCSRKSKTVIVYNEQLKTRS